GRRQPRRVLLGLLPSGLVLLSGLVRLVLVGVLGIPLGEVDIDRHVLGALLLRRCRVRLHTEGREHVQRRLRLGGGRVLGTAAVGRCGRCLVGALWWSSRRSALDGVSNVRWYRVG